MELSSLTDSQVEKQLQRLLGSEKQTLFEVLVHISEVDARKIFLRRAYGTLWDYLIQDCRYSPPAAQRRIDTVRLSFEIPDVLPRIRDGKLNLFQISTLQKGVRQKEKTGKVSTEEKMLLLGKLETTHFKETERVVALALGLKVIERSSFKAQTDESVRMAVTLSKECWLLLERCREILSQVVPSGAHSEVLEKVLEYFVSKQDLFLRTVTSESEVNPRQKHGPLPKKLREQILRRDKHCQFFDEQTQRTCGSTLRLQVDHIKMRCHGGTNEPANLRALCAAHNRQAAKDQLYQ